LKQSEVILLLKHICIHVENMKHLYFLTTAEHLDVEAFFIWPSLMQSSLTSIALSLMDLP